MIRKSQLLFCENDHGTGDVTFPDVNVLDGFELCEHFILPPTTASLRADAKAAGWGRVNGADYATEYAAKTGQNVIRSKRVHTSERDHACQKPVEVIAKLLEVATVDGGTILDPFMGSGTMLLAAKQLGRKAIGIELNEAHCESAAKRCQQEMALEARTMIHQPTGSVLPP